MHTMIGSISAKHGNTVEGELLCHRKSKFMKKRLHRHVRKKILYTVILAVFVYPVIGYAQQSRTFNPGRTRLKVADLISLLEKETHVRISYSDAIAGKLQQTVQLPAGNINLQTALDAMKSNAGLDYSMNQGFVVLKDNRQGETIIRGKVTDAKGGTPLPGVTIKIKGTGNGVLSGPDGSFVIKTPAGAVTLTVSYIGYLSREVKVTGGSTGINISLWESQTQLGEVQVTASRKVNNEVATLNERRNAGIVQDAISAAQMTKSGSITTTQALQRVTGVTITDDKYVAIRGLGDRSVIAQLNGARLSSADPDRSVVPLDIIPAGLLDNVTIYKTLSPDRPADASAGIVELKTRSIPDSLTLEFTTQAGFNSTIGLNGKYNGFYNNRLGFWGQRVKVHNLSADFQALKQQYPGGLVQIQEMFIQSRQNPALAAEAQRISNIMQRFEPVLTTSYQKADPNQVYNISFGNTFKLRNAHKLGIILNGNYYTRTEDIHNGVRNNYSLFQGVVTGDYRIFNQLTIPNFITPAYPRLGSYLSYIENTGKKTLNYGALAGITYRFSERHIIQAQFVGSRGAESVGSNLKGAWQNTGLTAPVYNTINQLELSYRAFDTYNLQGDHKLLTMWWSPRVSYNISSSRSTQNDPDFRSTNLANLYSVRYGNPGGVSVGKNEYAFVAGLVHGVGNDYSSIMVADPNGRQFRYLKEKNYNVKVDITQPFKITGKEQLLKFGVNFLRRDRISQPIFLDYQVPV
ncbi:hypothetical protein CK934_14830 [Chitinophaga sp. MD30]|nr:hypothetical protein CK934_14830 [Chitinophaga sp. MD30]